MGECLHIRICTPTYLPTNGPFTTKCFFGKKIVAFSLQCYFFELWFKKDTGKHGGFLSSGFEKYVKLQLWICILSARDLGCLALEFCFGPIIKTICKIPFGVLGFDSQLLTFKNGARISLQDYL